MLEEHGVTATQGTISNILKRFADLLGPANSDAALRSKRQRAVSYLLVDTALAKWITEYQGTVNISGDLIQEKAASFMKSLHPAIKDDDAPAFSIGWLQKIKNRHGIRMHRRLGESGYVDIEALEESLPGIRSRLDQYSVADIYNLDETGLFYRLQADSSISTHQLEGQKQKKSL